MTATRSLARAWHPQPQFVCLGLAVPGLWPGSMMAGCVDSRRLEADTTYQVTNKRDVTLRP